MSTAVYLRVSSKSQKVDSQKREVQRYLDGNGITDARWFVDTMSGAKIDRPGLAELRKAVFDGHVRTVVLYRLDRLARSIRDGINVLTEWLDAGVRIVIVTMQIDLSGALGRTVAALLLGLAQKWNGKPSASARRPESRRRRPMAHGGAVGSPAAR